MKKILIVSDNHGNEQILERVLKQYPNYDLYLHAGDSQSFEERLYPFISVKGNNDYFIDKLYRIVKVGNHQIFMTHGHKNYLSDEVMASCARNNKCDIFIHGHTHIPYYKIVDGVHIMCPGSLSYPRSSHGETYILMNIDEDNINVEIKKV